MVMQIPKNGIDGFLTDFTVLKASPSLSVEECGQCGSSIEVKSVVSYCCECATYLCEFCTQAHKKMKLCRNHHVQSAALKQNEPNVSSESTSTIISQPLFCKNHTDEMLIVYCKKCQCLVCRQCITDAHCEHKFSPIDPSTRVEVEKQVRGLLEESSKKLNHFYFYLGYVKAVESRKVSAPDKLKKQISDSYNGLMIALEKQRDELLSQVDTCSLKELWAQKEQLETTTTALQSSVAFAKRSLNCNSDAEMLALCPQVMSRLRELNLSQWDSATTEQIDSTQIVFRQASLSPPAAQFGILSNVSTVKNIPDLSMEIQSSKSHPKRALKEGQLGQQVRVILRFQLQPSFIGQPVNVKVLAGRQQNIKNQRFPPISIDSIENQCHLIEIVFRPVVSGQHTISVSIGSRNGQVNMKVSGKPNVGDRVVKGPNWQTPNSFAEPCEYQYYGYHGLQYNNGVVTDNKKVNMITVRWEGGVVTPHSWNECKNYFEIQLA